MNAHFPRGGLTDIPDDIDWVSSDVFDTAVFRAVACPRDVFLLIELQLEISGFTRMRTRAARDARKAMAPRGEYSLSDVYERLPAKADVSQELDLELALARPNPEVQAFLRQAKSCGKKIAFTTDMYLPREAIAALLKKCGYEYDALLVSSLSGRAALDDGRNPRPSDSLLQSLAKKNSQMRGWMSIRGSSANSF